MSMFCWLSDALLFMSRLQHGTRADSVSPVHQGKRSIFNAPRKCSVHPSGSSTLVSASNSYEADIHDDPRDRLPLTTPAMPSLPLCGPAGGPPLDGFEDLAQMTEFKAVYHSYDDQCLVEQRLLAMPNLRILHIRCTHDGPDPRTGVSYDPGCYNVATKMAESLTNYIALSPRLRRLYLDDVSFKPNELLHMVLKRRKVGCPLDKVQIRTPVMAAAECSALRQLVDFDHIRTHAKYGNLDWPGCNCRCECEGTCTKPGDVVSEVGARQNPTQGPNAPSSNEVRSAVSLVRLLESYPWVSAVINFE